MRQHKLVQGKSVEEQIASIDGLLSSVSSRKGISRPTIIPYSLDLTSATSGRCFFASEGTIKSICYSVGTVEKGTLMTLTGVCGNKTFVETFTVKSGRESVNVKMDIDKFTILTINFSTAVPDAFVGFLFYIGVQDATSSVSA